jgi:hypothetical protein
MLKEGAGEFRGFLELLTHVNNDSNFVLDFFGKETKPDLNKYQVGGRSLECKPKLTLTEVNFIETKLDIIQGYLDRHFTYAYPILYGNPVLAISAFSGSDILYRPLLDGPDVVVFQDMRRLDATMKKPKRNFKDEFWSEFDRVISFVSSIDIGQPITSARAQWLLVGTVSPITVYYILRDKGPSTQINLVILKWVEVLLINASQQAALLWRAVFDKLISIISDLGTVLVGGEAVGDPLFPRDGVSSGEAAWDVRRKKEKLEGQITISNSWTVGFWILQVVCERYGFFRVYTSPDTLSFFLQFLGFPIVNYFLVTVCLSKLSEYDNFTKKKERATKSFNEQSYTRPLRSSSTDNNASVADAASAQEKVDNLVAAIMKKE